MTETEVRSLGHGAFGNAVLVKRGPLYLVLKKVNLAGMSQYVKNMQVQEAKLLRELSHPNIVAYKGCTQEANMLHLYMEYCAGGDLLVEIRERGTQHFPEPTVLVWMRQLASALQYIHTKRILHRDIKPNNIFLNEEKTSLKLGDFGLARVFSPQTFVADTQLGTLAYMAPEVLRMRPYNEKADMYSLGACMFHVTALTHPRVEVEIPATFSVSLRNLIVSLLADNPANRPSAQAVVEHSALGPSPEQVQIIIHDFSGDRIPLRVTPETMTIADVKIQLQEHRGIEPGAISVSFNGKILKDDKTLAFYKVGQGHSLKLILNYVGGGGVGIKA